MYWLSMEHERVFHVEEQFCPSVETSSLSHQFHKCKMVMTLLDSWSLLLTHFPPILFRLLFVFYHIIAFYLSLTHFPTCKSKPKVEIDETEMFQSVLGPLSLSLLLFSWRIHRDLVFTCNCCTFLGIRVTIYPISFSLLMRNQ